MIDVNFFDKQMTTDLTPEQCRGARAMLGWSQHELAIAANVGRQTIADFERGARVPISNNLMSIREALQRAGIGFLSENGIRLERRN